MLLLNFIMVKVFLTATAVGMLVTALLEYLGYVTRSAKAQTLGLPWFNGYDGNIIGGLILGAGMAVGGVCPGVVWAQLGAGLYSGKYAIAGGFLGALTVGFVHRYMLHLTNGAFLQKRDSFLLDKKLNIPGWVAALLFSSILFMAVFFYRPVCTI
jgi:uncharacterized membrane protein YedE/YeeE